MSNVDVPSWYMPPKGLVSNEILDNFTTCENSLFLDYNKGSEDFMELEDSKAMDFLDIDSIIAADINFISSQREDSWFKNHTEYQDTSSHSLHPDIYPVTTQESEVQEMNRKMNLYTSPQVCFFSIKVLNGKTLLSNYQCKCT